MFRVSYSFGRRSDVAGSRMVCHTDLYKEESGYGFVTEKNYIEQEKLRIPELNSGFQTAPYGMEQPMTVIEEIPAGCFVDSVSLLKQMGEPNGEKIPLIFKAKVPRMGNYKVKLHLQSLEKNNVVLIFLGRRRLVSIKKLMEQEVFTGEFVVNVSDIIPRGFETVHTDRTIDLAIIGGKTLLSYVEIRECKVPTLYIAGDSTVTDQSTEYPYHPGLSYSGWGQMISAFLSVGIAVSNHSHSGLTTESFQSEGHYEILKGQLSPKDYCCLQFGHNDQKLAELKAQEGYRERLCTYIDEIRSVGALPILVTPLARNSWRGIDGSYNDLLEEYADACIEIGEEYEVPVIRLHELSKAFLLEHGLQESRQFFYPNDFTHTNDVGAYQMAEYVAEEIQKIAIGDHFDQYHELGTFLRKKEEESFGQSIWKKFGFAPVTRVEEAFQPTKLKKVVHTVSAAAVPEIERPEESLLRIEGLDFVIKKFGYFSINVYNDLFEDVIGHEWYAGIVECALQNGIIQASGQHCILKPQEPLSIEQFLCYLMAGYRSRNGQMEGAQCSLDSDCDPESKDSVRLAYQMGLISDRTDIKEIITRRAAFQLCNMVKQNEV